MARRRSSGDSSLELLLDTICNTFGGVLFLAMLVSLMLTQTRRKGEATPADPAPAVSAADLVRLDTRAEDANRAVEALAKQVAEARRVAGDLSVPGADELLTAMEDAEARARAAEERRRELLANLAEQQAAIARVEAAKAADDRERQRLAEEALRARTRLAAAVREREVLVASAIRIRDDAARRVTVRTTGRSPRMQDSDKTEFGLMIRYGRLYLMKRLQGGGLVVNTTDFTITRGNPNSARAKPHAGLDLQVVEGRDASLRRIVADFPASKWYACLVVFPDSFEEYLIVKNWLVDHGYGYKLLPTDSGAVDRGGGNGPQVQ